MFLRGDHLKRPLHQVDLLEYGHRSHDRYWDHSDDHHGSRAYDHCEYCDQYEGQGCPHRSPTY
jgi:hypothetical protein